MGKTLLIDESTRFNRDFVRLKIACRDVNLVPPSAKCSLGMLLYDFYFEKDEPVEDNQDMLKTKIQVDSADGRQPSVKKMKTSQTSGDVVGTGVDAQTSLGENVSSTYGKSGGKDVKWGGSPIKLSSSAPGKFNFAIHNVVSKMKNKQDLLPGESQQDPNSLTSLSQDEVIPAATYDPRGEADAEVSEENSDTSCDYEREVMKVMGSDAESSKKREHLFMARCTQFESEESLHKVLHKPLPSGKSATIEGIPLDLSKLVNPCDDIKAKRFERRTSERIQKNMVVEKSSNKRSLEGNHIPSSNSFSMLDNDELITRSTSMGVDLHCANFDSIDMLRNMEEARNALYNKQNQSNTCSPITESPLEVGDILNQDEGDSDTDGEPFTVVTSKRNKKPVVRLSLSGRKPPNTRHKENPCGRKKSQTQSKSKT